MEITENIACMILSNIEAAASEGMARSDAEFDDFLRELLEKFPNAVEESCLWWMKNSVKDDEYELLKKHNYD